ncbi:MAG: TlpA family protein disulfide reductase [Candidatus Omnitrophica bacterium]|nr:TlpA family protein disulfide reductase [Candidatus Omnitrophota bacterium]
MRLERLIGAILLGGLGASGLASAEQIKLQDGTEFAGSILGRDGDRIVIGLSRSSVAAVDGQTLPPPVTTGATAPAFSAVDLNGTTQTLGAEQGEATLVHFWASWCPHCRSDVPLMKDLFARYQGKGLRIVTVSLDQDVSKLAQFMKDQQLPYPVVAAYQDPASPNATLPELYEAQGVPAYYLIDANGVVAKTFSGSVTEGNMDLESDLQKLLATASKRGT